MQSTFVFKLSIHFLQHVLFTLKFRAILQFACVKLLLKLVYQNQAIQGKVPTLSLRLTTFWPTFCESLAICYLLAWRQWTIRRTYDVPNLNTPLKSVTNMQVQNFNFYKSLLLNMSKSCFFQIIKSDICINFPMLGRQNIQFQ